jgi:putative membrane protein
MPYDMYDHGGYGGGWIVMVIVMVIFWGAVAVVAVAALRHYSATRTPELPTGASAIEVLRMRFATGEIDEAEFQRRLELLQSQK